MTLNTPTLNTATLAYTLSRMLAWMTRSAAPARVTLRLTPQDCQLQRRRPSSYGVIQQDVRMGLGLAFHATLQPGWLWSTLTLQDGETPRSAPITIPHLPKRQARRWLYTAKLYQINLVKQLRLVRKSPWKPIERQRWELKRRELFAHARLPQKYITSDDILLQLWNCDLAQIPYEETIESEKKANFGAVSEQEAQTNSITRKNRNPLLEDA